MSDTTYVQKVKKLLPLFECADGTTDELGLIEYCQTRFGLSPRLAESVVGEAMGKAEEE